ncbi:MAG: OPT oligopeptide transporter protein [Acidobacteria bacterium ADurb.Bin340]|nr:MAG: OPT oligopeptide transporter protein [Acidobacteria bacterium ADurb.Bin340]
MQPFVPSNQNMKEFTFKAVAFGLLMCVVLGAANAYLGLKAGMTIAATYPAAVIGMALIKLFKGTILEENIARTVGSIGESVAAGAIFTIPAFVIGGIWPKFFTAGNYLTSAFIMFSGGLLGIMFVALLRRVMVEDAELPYPESMAAAEIHKAGQGGASGTKFLFGAMAVGGVVQALSAMSLFATTWTKWVPFKATLFNLTAKGKAAAAQGGLVLTNPGISPAFMGVGYIIGPKLGSLTFAGGMIAWGLLVPIITYFVAPGVLPEQAGHEEWIALSKAVFGGIVKPIAIGGMLVGASFTLFKMRNSLITGLKRSIGDVKKAASGEHTVDRINQDIAFTWILAGVAFSALCTLLIAKFIFGTSLIVAVVAGLLAVILGFFFAAVSGYLVGIIGSSNNPMSGLTLTALVVTALVMVMLGVKGNPGIAAVLGVAAIVCVSSGVAGEMLQDLKAGHILGGTPWRMQVGDILGVILSAAVLFLPLVVLHEGPIKEAANRELGNRAANQVQVVTYSGDRRPDLKGDHTLDQIRAMDPDSQKEVLGLDAGFGSTQLPAPQAGLMADLSRGIVGGNMQWALIVVGMLMGLGLVLMQVKSPMIVSVGMYLPFSTTFAICLGGLIKGVVERLGEKKGFSEAQKTKVENVGVLVAAGLIAGEALVGLVFATFAFFEVPYTVFKEPRFFVLSLIILAVVAAILIRVPLKNAGEKDA